ncbi:YrdB family protein [Enterococcus sp. LJL120]
MDIIFLINSGLRFLLEIGSVVILVIAGFSKQKFQQNILVGLILPTLFILLWAFFVAPASTTRASIPIRLSIEFVIYLSTALVIYKSYTVRLAVMYLIFSLLNSLLNVFSDTYF